MRHLPTCTAYRHGGEGIHGALTVVMGRGVGMCRYCSPIVGKRMEREGPIYTQEVFKVQVHSEDATLCVNCMRSSRSIYGDGLQEPYKTRREKEHLQKI